MKISPFALERYFAKYEFTASYLLSSSDCESLCMSELLGMADSEMKGIWDNLCLGYTESPGHPRLRKEIINLYQVIEGKNVLVMVPEEAIFLTMHALLEPGDHVICPSPAYQSLHEVARAIGCHVSEWQPKEELGWHFDVNDLAGLIRPDTKLLVVNFPHNPTGSLPDKNDFDEILRLIADRGIYLLSDEMYRYLEIDEGARLPSSCDLYDRGITLSGLSKSFGLPGLRIGWLSSQNREFLDRVAVLKDYSTICNSAPSEILAIIALRNWELITSRQLNRTRRNLLLLDEFFARSDDLFLWNRPRGGSVCFPRMLTEMGTKAFCQELVEQTGIMLVPSTVFQFGDNHVRIGFGRENLLQVLGRFADYLRIRFGYQSA